MSEEYVVSDQEALDTYVACLEDALEQSEGDAIRKEMAELRERVADAFEFAANQLRPLFGQGTLAVVFDGCAEGIRKVSK